MTIKSSIQIKPQTVVSQRPKKATAEQSPDPQDSFVPSSRIKGSIKGLLRGSVPVYGALWNLNSGLSAKAQGKEYSAQLANAGAFCNVLGISMVGAGLDRTMPSLTLIKVGLGMLGASALTAGFLGLQNCAPISRRGSA